MDLARLLGIPTSSVREVREGLVTALASVSRIEERIDTLIRRIDTLNRRLDTLADYVKSKS